MCLIVLANYSGTSPETLVRGDTLGLRCPPGGAFSRKIFSRDRSLARDKAIQARLHDKGARFSEVGIIGLA